MPAPRCFSHGTRIAFPFPVAEVKPVTATAPKRGGRKLAPAFFAVVLAVLGAWWWSTQRNVGASPNKQEISQIKSTLHLETFVVNLADRDQRSYLRVGVDLGLSQEMQPGEQSHMARVRDTILGVLATAKADDLLTAEGKSKLKTDLLQSLREQVPELGVAEVYFTELLIQR
jgi:flagellar basal body-associated protein FliL